MANDVSIARSDFLAALKRLRLVRSPKDVPEALISMEGEDLCFSVIGVATYAPAKGTWTGEVRISGALLLAMANTPPPGDPMHIFVREGRCYFGSMSTNCVEQDGWRSEIELPLDPGLDEILRIAFRHSAEEIEKAGLRLKVEDARARASKLVSKAAVILAPLGITGTDLRDLVVSKLKA